MTDAPERIWALKDALDDSDGLWVSAVYRRADMPPPSNWPQCTLYFRFDVVPRWQPIETAPKDGTWILAYEPDENGGTIEIVQWGAPQWSGEGFDWVTVALGPNPDTMELTGATHWMPLPEPPK